VEWAAHQQQQQHQARRSISLFIVSIFVIHEWKFLFMIIFILICLNGTINKNGRRREGEEHETAAARKQRLLQCASLAVRLSLRNTELSFTTLLSVAKRETENHNNGSDGRVELPNESIFHFMRY